MSHAVERTSAVGRSE